MPKCMACEDKLKWNDDVIIVNEKLYHTDCVTLYPTGFMAFIDDECLGETDNEGGQMACEIIDSLLTDEDD
ncbi:hypothetical protein [Bacillus sp. Hm123]|uniref:hypothetical protein n=1 Tax=Bacillus sp. Hm123 TaxID=3450745 RepID=UPI003F42AB08